MKIYQIALAIAVAMFMASAYLSSGISSALTAGFLCIVVWVIVEKLARL